MVCCDFSSTCVSNNHRKFRQMEQCQICLSGVRLNFLAQVKECKRETTAKLDDAKHLLY